MNENNDVPLLEEVVFPDNDMDEALSGTESTPCELDKTQILKALTAAVEEKLDGVIERAIFRAMKNSIPLLVEEMKDEVKGEMLQELDRIVPDIFSKL